MGHPPLAWDGHLCSCYLLVSALLSTPVDAGLTRRSLVDVDADDDEGAVVGAVVVAVVVDVSKTSEK